MFSRLHEYIKYKYVLEYAHFTIYFVHFLKSQLLLQRSLSRVVLRAPRTKHIHHIQCKYTPCTRLNWGGTKIYIYTYISLYIKK